MIGLDTNVLVRYIVEDDLKQTALANKRIESCNEDEPAFISHLVLAELVWVLLACYEAEKVNILEVLENLLLTRQFAFELPQSIHEAISDYKTVNADFADCLIARSNNHYSVIATYTFDKKAAKLSSMCLLKSSPV